MMIPIVLSTISICLCVISFFFFRWYIARKTAARELLADYRAEVHRLIAEIDAATDRDSLLVEERIKILRKLLEDTDRRIAVYMRELQRSRSGELMYASLGRGIRVALDSNPQETPASQEVAIPQETAAPQERLPLLEAMGAQEPASPQRPASSAKPVSPAKPAPKKTTAPKKRKTNKPKLKIQIAELSARGLPPQEIASRLHISIVEVELALNLLNRPGYSG